MPRQIDANGLLALEKMDSFENLSHICLYYPNIYGIKYLVNHEFSWIYEDN